MGGILSRLTHGEFTVDRRSWRTRATGLAVATLLAAAAPLAAGTPAVAAADTGSISGTVSDSRSAAPLEQISVSVRSETNDQDVAHTVTDATGSFVLADLPADAYLVEFDADDASLNYVTQWWEGATSPGVATPVSVTAGEEVAGLNVQLEQGGALTGVVTDTAGTPLSAINVPVWSEDGTDWTLFDTARTDENGQYSITSLPLGSYRVGFSDGEIQEQPEQLVGTVYEPQFYAGKSSLTAADTIKVESAGEIVTVAAAALALAKKEPAPALVVDRFAGANRYLTAVDISQESFEPGVPVVYVATGLSFPDALAAAPAAAKQGGPLLLTAATSLPTAVVSEIERLKPLKIVVVGGTGAVSTSVYNQLSGLTPSIRRDSGVDRFETSRMIIRNAFPNGSETAFIATAWDFPDALAASAAAGATNAPVVLVDGKAAAVDTKTKALLSTLKVKKAVVAGGTGVVSSKMESSMKYVLGAANVTRLGGADRYTTALLINRASFAQSDTVYLANGKNFADALAGAALAGKNKAPLYAVYTKCLPKTVLADITSLKATRVVLLGGDGVLTSTVERLRPCI